MDSGKVGLGLSKLVPPRRMSRAASMYLVLDRLTETGGDSQKVAASLAGAGVGKKAPASEAATFRDPPPRACQLPIIGANHKISTILCSRLRHPNSAKCWMGSQVLPFLNLLAQNIGSALFC